MKVEINKNSGFCFGVVNAIKVAEEALTKTDKLYSLGDIVHNGAEIKRLNQLGLVTISKEEYFKMQNCHVLIRAHGEPPETYAYAKANSITLIDATCPVVLKLQKRIKKSYKEGLKTEGQIVLLGKQGHAEVIGLAGQTENKAIILTSEKDLDKIDYHKPITIYSQTTFSLQDFNSLTNEIKQRAENAKLVTAKDTVCRQVANRVPQLKKFVNGFDLILFVSGKKSSNGRFLYEECKKINPNTRFVSFLDELEKEWLSDIKSVGICGATSTPQWLMEDVAEWVKANVLNR